MAASRRDASRRPRAAERRNLSMGVEKKVGGEKVVRGMKLEKRESNYFFLKIKD